MTVEIVVVLETVPLGQEDIYDRQIDLAMQQLVQAVKMGCGVTIMAHTPPDRLRKRVENFTEQHADAVQMVILDPPALPLFEALQLATQHKAPQDWVLGCSIWDHLRPEALALLLAPPNDDEAETETEAVLFGHGWTIGGGSWGMAAADLPHLQAGRIDGAMPHLSRLALRVAFLHKLADAAGVSALPSDAALFGQILQNRRGGAGIRIVPEWVV